MKLKLKSVMSSLLIVLAGVIAGYFVFRLGHLPKPAVVEGNYSEILEKKDTNVVVFGRDTCTFCKQAKEYFIANNVKFVYLNIESDTEAKAEFENLDGDSVPLIIIGSRKIAGLNIKEIENSLGKIGLLEKK